MDRNGKSTDVARRVQTETYQQNNFNDEDSQSDEEQEIDPRQLQELLKDPKFAAMFFKNGIASYFLSNLNFRRRTRI
jgi:hypothetical protein